MEASAGQPVAHPLLEREAECEELAARIAAAGGGRGSACLIAGPAGIGKSALLRFCAEQARATGARALNAACSHLERQFSYGVAIELLAAPAAESVARGERPFTGPASLAHPLFEGESIDGDHARADATFGLYLGLRALLANLSATARPLVICVDDVQWCDEPTAGFLAYAARRLRSLPIALVAALREGEPTAERVSALLETLHAPEAGAVLRPRALSVAASSAWVRREHPEASDGACAALATASGGNPFYLGELLADVRRAGVGANEITEVERASPESVRRSVMSRVQRAGADAASLAEAVAVLGAAATLGDAGRLAGLDPSRAARAADGLLELGLLAATDPPAFEHPVVGAAVRDSVSPARLALAHRDAADVLRARGAAAETVAAQLLEATPQNEGWVVSTLERAAARARERGSPEAAVRYLQRALEEAPGDRKRGELLVDLGLAESAAGKDAGAAHVAEGVALLDAPRARAGGLYELAMLQVHQGRYPHSEATASRALSELGDGDPALAKRLTVARDNSAVWVDLTDAAATRTRAERAIAGADPAQPAGRSALANAAVALTFTDSTCEEVGAVARRAIEGHEPTGDPFDGHAFPVAGYALVAAEDPAAAERAMTVAIEAIESRGSMLELAGAVHTRSVARLALGRVDDAIADAEATVEAGRWGWGATLPFAHSRLVVAYLEQGRVDAAAAALALPGGEERWAVNATYGTWLVAAAEVALMRGDVDAAIERLELCGRLAELVHARSPAVIAWRGCLARALIAGGERDRAADLARAEADLARRVGAQAALGVALRVEGLALGPQGTARLRESVGALAPTQYRLELGRSRLELGSGLRHRGSLRAARAELRSALDLAHRCGATALADRAREELRLAGARPRRDALTGIEALTAAERRVAALAAAGDSNPDIARALHVTRRTVEMHLSAVYAKLEIGSRTQLPPELTRDGPRDVHQLQGRVGR